MEKVEFTNMCMIHNEDKVLVIDRKKEDWPGITFPGGHVELAESFTEAVIREVEEETGLTIYSPQLCGVKDWYENQTRFVVLLYQTNHFEGELVSSEEGEVWWEPIDNLVNLKLSLDMEDMVRVFMEDNLSEFYYRQDGDSWVYDLK
ncbi:8-oxo-dGTP diphosphatase [Facklamia sp. DSM 111018]|uniref:8-oxo-dGTP diphosphatase n=1 Tax=Facklamia lactis TaxID=2749967 RepID=A0ABS0LRU6_9LACT|nr:8-oxo-dGTP diphosphatase [Facklamia lactis]MBG9980372.1 8-oxo-dGTP diphosphatase [Facklamia lactis]MBG9986175.1 8-oxo-dGTP diphosphatase [Facklamia lactis]